MARAKYLLDTNIVSDLTRHPQGIIAEKIEVVGESKVCTSIIVASELRFGAVKRSSRQLSERVDLILAALSIVAIEPPVDIHYAEIRLYLERKGAPIGPNDLLIAAQARALGLTVVTANEREFSRVPGLAVENWLGD